MAENYDVISFDVFDTLVLRTVGEPADVFSLMEKETGDKGFKGKRIRAEEIARGRTLQVSNSTETDLACIYDVMRDEYGTDRGFLDLEVETEREVCVANPYFLEIYEKLLSLRKEMIAVTDMYLPERIVREILGRCGYKGISEVFVSCAFKKGKGDGSLQRYVKENYLQGRRMLHCGDNYDSDVLQTEKCGIDAYYYSGVRENPAGREIFQTEGLENSFYRGIVQNMLCCGLPGKSKEYEYGFQTAGILTYGFCRWIVYAYNTAQADFVLFSGSECLVFYKVFKDCFPTIPSGYITGAWENGSEGVPRLQTGNVREKSARILAVDFSPEENEHETSLGAQERALREENIVRRYFYQFDEKKTGKEGVQAFLSVPDLFTEDFLLSCCIFIGEVERGKEAVPSGKDAKIAESGFSVRDAQDGILDFARQYSDAVDPFEGLVDITPGASAGPFLKNLAVRRSSRLQRMESAVKGKKALLISHEFTYTGAPHSLLRMAGAMQDAGCDVEVWGPEKGPFLREFKKKKIRCRILPPEDLKGEKSLEFLKDFDLAVVNTVYADRYYELIKAVIPTVWIIREASDLKSCCENAPERMQAVQNAGRIYCVSEYAAECLKQYNGNIRVLRNCVEDNSGSAGLYSGPRDGVVRFVQLGTLEERKGYDLILDAYCLLPDELKNRTEICFAGKLPDFQKGYWKNLLERLKGFRNIRYLGEIRDTDRKNKTISESDVVLVASRDEACSLVALEGAMLSKPLLLSSNVGAKYMVRGGNGVIFESGDVRSLARGMAYFLENPEKIPDMGAVSRKNYLELAGMDRYREEMLSLLGSEICLGEKGISVPEGQDEVSVPGYFSDKKEESRVGRKEKSPSVFEKVRKVWRYFRENGPAATIRYVHNKRAYLFSLTCGIMNFFRDRRKKSYFRKYRGRQEKILVSVTSYPGRIRTTAKSIKSIFKQWLKPDSIWLILSKEQFPEGERGLPDEVLTLKKKGLEIKWEDIDLKAHKNYFYAMRENPDSIVITMDDDIVYGREVVGTLYESYLSHPDCVSCMRAQKITLKDGHIAGYREWDKDVLSLVGKPSHEVFAMEAGAILYPPGSLPEEAFDPDCIKENCLNTADLWLKFMELKAGIKVVLSSREPNLQIIDGTQDNALYFANAFRGGYDRDLALLVEKFPEVETTLAESI